MKSEIISDDGEEKTCQCREDMRWNSKALECQVEFWNWLKESAVIKRFFKIEICSDFPGCWLQSPELFNSSIWSSACRCWEGGATKHVMWSKRRWFWRKCLPKVEQRRRGWVNEAEKKRKILALPDLRLATKLHGRIDIARAYDEGNICGKVLSHQTRGCSMYRWSTESVWILHELSLHEQFWEKVEAREKGDCLEQKWNANRKPCGQSSAGLEQKLLKVGSRRVARGFLSRRRGVQPRPSPRPERETSGVPKDQLKSVCCALWQVVFLKQFSVVLQGLTIKTWMNFRFNPIRTEGGGPLLCHVFAYKCANTRINVQIHVWACWKTWFLPIMSFE